MATITRTTDEKARITLPGNFANCTVLIDETSDTELRIRKARVIPVDEFPFVPEETMTPLSDRDRDVFLNALDNPPPPNDALRQLMHSKAGDANSDERRPAAKREKDKAATFEAFLRNGCSVSRTIAAVARMEPSLRAKPSSVRRWVNEFRNWGEGTVKLPSIDRKFNWTPGNGPDVASGMLLERVRELANEPTMELDEAKKFLRSIDD